VGVWRERGEGVGVWREREGAWTIRTVGIPKDTLYNNIYFLGNVMMILVVVILVVLVVLVVVCR